MIDTEQNPFQPVDYEKFWGLSQENREEAARELLTAPNSLYRLSAADFQIHIGSETEYPYLAAQKLDPLTMIHLLELMRGAVPDNRLSITIINKEYFSFPDYYHPQIRDYIEKIIQGRSFVSVSSRSSYPQLLLELDFNASMGFWIKIVYSADEDGLSQTEVTQRDGILRETIEFLTNITGIENIGVIENQEQPATQSSELSLSELSGYSKHFETLGINFQLLYKQKKTAREILIIVRIAYRRMAKLYHPDGSQKIKKKWHGFKWLEVDNAYSILADFFYKKIKENSF